MSEPDKTVRKNSAEKKSHSKKSRLFLVRRRDRAIPRTLTSRSAPFSWRQLKDCRMFINVFDKYSPTKYPQYDLLHLCGIQEDIPVSDENYLASWWSKTFLGSDHDSFVVKSYFVDELLDLAPFLTSERMKPDLCVVNNGIPILWNEIHSEYDYNHTITQCVLGLIAQLRYVKCFDQKIKSVCGFVFPRKKSDSHVTLVKVEWEELLFRISRHHIPECNVIEQIDKVLEDQRRFANIIDTNTLSDYFIGLSKQDLVYLEGVLGTESELVQRPSYSAILVKDEKFYYKIVPDQFERETLRNIKDCYMKYLHESKHAKSFRHLVLPNEVIVLRSLPIFRFDSQPYQPLDRGEASKCLKDFVTQAKRALEELHQFGYVHFDVRLPNFCYSRDFEAMLIDFDRAIPVTLPPSSDVFHYFHRVPSENTIGIDFKQLGILIYSVIEGKDMEQVNVLSDTDFKDSHDFIRQLVIHGEFDKQLFDHFFESHQECNQSIQSVILDRIPSSASDN